MNVYKKSKLFMTCVYMFLFTTYDFSVIINKPIYRK